jgi:hypothetical protein
MATTAPTVAGAICLINCSLECGSGEWILPEVGDLPLPNIQREAVSEYDETLAIGSNG